MKTRKTAEIVFALAIGLIAIDAAHAAHVAPTGRSIVDVAAAVDDASDEFSILIQALRAADPAVIDDLRGGGPFTFFAPTDAAFVALLGELGLSADEFLSDQPLVTQVLLYHLADGHHDSADVLGGSGVRTLEGGFLVQSDGVLIDENGRNAYLIDVDIQATNGVIHVVDRVVLTAGAARAVRPGRRDDICVGIRGNGERVTAHFGALARIIEHYGVPEGGAGGSSGSISLFFLESVAMNPLVYDCGGRTCTRREHNDRAALLFKSILGYLEVLKNSDEGLSFAVLIKIISRVKELNIPELLETDPDEALNALKTILTSPDVRALVNPEVLYLLATSPDPIFHARDIVGALEAAARFEPTGDTMFLRPGVLNFEGFAWLLGRIAGFLAAYEPTNRARMNAWMEDCASPGRGMVWPELKALPSGDGTCGEVFASIAEDYRAALRAHESAYPSRADDMVGSVLRVLVAVAVLEGDAVTEWKHDRASYLAAARPDTDKLDVSFSDVRFGYWGHKADLARVTRNPNRYTDLKTSKATSLGEATWGEVLSRSPAEPNLSRALEIPDGRVSAGGWSDLQPTLVLQNLGCEHVVYLTRRGSESRFSQGVARLLGAKDEDIDALYSLSDNASSSYVSIQEADGVWCTDWDTPTNTDVVALTRDAYAAPFETIEDHFETVDDPYPGITPHTGLAGCTLGVVVPEPDMTLGLLVGILGLGVLKQLRSVKRAR
jgi:uncharacterized surface protein with fasciclin (FAS1) repeats